MLCLDMFYNTIHLKSFTDEQSTDITETTRTTLLQIYTIQDPIHVINKNLWGKDLVHWVF